MSFIWEFVGAIFAVTAAIIAITIASLCLYAVVVGIQSAIDERRKKKARKSKKDKREA